MDSATPPQRAIADSIAQRVQQTQLNLALHVGKLFERLDEPALGALRAELDLVLLRGGEVLVRQGEPSDALYLVINGRLVKVDDPAHKLIGYYAYADRRRYFSISKYGGWASAKVAAEAWLHERKQPAVSSRRRIVCWLPNR